MNSQPALAVEQLSLSYRGDHGLQRVVHNVSFDIHPGEMVALVGESGSGKTTTAQAIIGLLAENGVRDAGVLRFNGEDISQWSQSRLDRLRGAQISLIPQDPGSSLNPIKTIGDQVGEIISLHQRLSRKARDAQVLALLERVGLSHPAERMRQYPHQLSGGMKQRVLIAIAIALQPALIIADEPTSALDVTVQRRILDLIDTLRHEFTTAVLFVTHDLALAAERADRIIVFRHGEIQEQERHSRSCTLRRATIRASCSTTLTCWLHSRCPPSVRRPLSWLRPSASGLRWATAAHPGYRR